MDRHTEVKRPKKKRIWLRLVGVLLIVSAAYALLYLFTDISIPGRLSRNQSEISADDKENSEGGIIQTGYAVKDGKAYYYNRFGRPSAKGWIHSDEGDFYCVGDGELATGWKYLDKKAYYFYQEDDVSDSDVKLGDQAKAFTTKGMIDIPEEGCLDGDEGQAVGYALDVLNRFGWDLESAYRYSAALGFIPGSDEHYGFTVPGCAIQGFKYGEGNCLAWAGTFCAMAQVMNYDARLIWGTLEWRGEDVPHGWVEIWMDDGIHVYDPRKNDGEDMAGFDVRYGEKGTRKYNEDSKEEIPW